MSDPVPHTASDYSHGCRCESCLTRYRDYMRNYMRLRRRFDQRIAPRLRRAGLTNVEIAELWPDYLASNRQENPT